MSNTLSTNKFTKKAGIQKVKEYLESGRSVTPLEALGNWGMFRLATAINVLRKRGMDIRTDLKEDPNGKTYAQYTLEKPKAAPKKLEAGARVRLVKATCNEPAGSDGVIRSIHRNPNAMWPYYVYLDGQEAVLPCSADEVEAI